LIHAMPLQQVMTSGVIAGLNIPLIFETPKKQEYDDPENLKRVREMILK